MPVGKTYKPNAFRGALSSSYIIILAALCFLPVLILGVIGSSASGQTIVGEILIAIFFFTTIFPLLAIFFKLASQSYEVKPDRIEMRRGVIFKSMKVIHYSQIADVRKFKGLPSGVLRTCDLILVSTPTSAETISSLSEAEADELKDFLLKSIGKQESASQPTESQTYYIGLEKTALYKIIIIIASILALIILYFI